MNQTVSQNKKQAVLLIWLLVTTILSAYGFITPQQIMTTAQILEALETASPEEIAGLLQIALNSSFNLLQKTYSYIVSQVGSYTCIQNGTTGKLDSYGTNAATVTQSVIDAHVNPNPTTIYCKGTITLNSEIIFENKQNLKFIFERILLNNNDACIVVANKTVPEPTIIHGIELNTVAYYSGSAVHVYNALFGAVNICSIEGGGGRTGNAIKLESDSGASGVGGWTITVDRIAGYNNSLLLTVGSVAGHISRNIFYVKSVGWCRCGVKIEARTTGGVFGNTFYSFGVNPPSPSGYAVSYGINITGKALDNSFYDYYADEVAEDGSEVSYSADSYVIGTVFTGGMPRMEVANCWDDKGSCTEFVSCWNVTGLCRYTLVNQTG